MTTRTIFLVLITTIFISGASLIQAQSSNSNYVFELTDGYFQSGIGKPVHLIHKPPYSTQWVNLNEGVRLWYNITLRQGEKSPCDKRSQTPCSINVGFVSLSDPKYSFGVIDSIRIENELAINYNIPIDRKTTPFGAGKFVWVIEKEGKTLFYHEILVEVG